MNEIKLDKCPFCGSTNVSIHVNNNVCVGHGVYVDEFRVLCKGCGASSGKVDTYGLSVEKCYKAVTELWNRRPV